MLTIIIVYTHSLTSLMAVIDEPESRNGRNANPLTLTSMRMKSSEDVLKLH